MSLIKLHSQSQCIIISSVSCPVINPVPKYCWISRLIYENYPVTQNDDLIFNNKFNFVESRNTDIFLIYILKPDFSGFTHMNIKLAFLYNH